LPNKQNLMKLRVLGTLMLSITVCFAVAQQPDSLIKKLDSLSTKTDRAGGQKNDINRNEYNEQTKINAPVYFNNYHRYAKHQKGSVSLGFQYEHNVLMSRMVYHFRS